LFVGANAEMPDAATHVLLPLVGLRLIEIVKKKELVSSSSRYLLAFGCLFPDLIDKTIPYTFKYLIRAGEYMEILPENNYYFPLLEYLHTPLMLLICVYVFCFIFRVEYRKRVFYALSTGVIIHLVFDLFQGNICCAGYLWLFPFSFKKPEIITIFYDDQTVPLVPVFLAVFVMLEIIFRYVARKNILCSSNDAEGD
tara:strand:+ start:69 stop:659 length:591 start_codon:yes stop_codon:yes gene_type:complete